MLPSPKTKHPTKFPDTKPPESAIRKRTERAFPHNIHHHKKRLSKAPLFGARKLLALRPPPATPRRARAGAWPGADLARDWPAGKRGRARRAVIGPRWRKADRFTTRRNWSVPDIENGLNRLGRCAEIFEMSTFRWVPRKVVGFCLFGGRSFWNREKFE